MSIPKLDGHKSHVVDKNADISALRQQISEEFAVVENLIKSSQQNVHHFMAMFASISKLPIDTCIDRFKKMLAAAETQLRQPDALDLEANPQGVVPAQIHRIWITNAGAPVEPPAQYISSLLRDVRDYSPRGWTHNFWVQDPSLIPQAIERLRSADGKMRVRTIAEAGMSDRTFELFQAFIKDRKFPFAADILRMAVLYKEGGVYGDLGAKFLTERHASIFRKNFDYALIFWETMFFQNSFMMMPAANKIAKTFLEITDDPYSLPEEMLKPLSGLREGMAFSGLLITAIILSMYDLTMRICPLASNVNLVTWSAQQSWYTNVGDKIGKFGNTYVPESGPSFFELAGWRDRKPDRTHTIFRPVR